MRETEKAEIAVPSEHHHVIQLVGAEVVSMIEKRIIKLVPEEYQCIAALDSIISVMAYFLDRVTKPGHERESYNHVIDALNKIYDYKFKGIHAPDMLVHGEAKPAKLN